MISQTLFLLFENNGLIIGLYLFQKINGRIIDFSVRFRYFYWFFKCIQSMLPIFLDKWYTRFIVFRYFLENLQK